MVSSVPVSWRLGGRLAMTLVATINDVIFFFLSFLRHLLFSQKEGSDQKTYFAKVDRSSQKPRGRHLSRTPRPFWGPLVAILDFAGGAALQVVSECPRRRWPGIHVIPI